MAWNFDKNTSNYLEWSPGSFGGAIDGESVISIAMMVMFDEAGTNADDFLWIPISDTASDYGIRFFSNNASGRFQVNCRSEAAELFESDIVNTNFTFGEYHMCGAIIDYAGDQLGAFYDEEGNLGSASFTQTSYTDGAPATEPDGVGARVLAAGPSSTTNMLNGAIQYLAVWNANIGEDAMAMVGRKYSPRFIRRDAMLMLYEFEDGVSAPRSIVDTPAGLDTLSVTGSFTRRERAPLKMPSRPQTIGS